MQNKTILWLLVGGVALLALLSWILPASNSPGTAWTISGENPWRIGTPEEPFAYGGAPNATRIDGSAVLHGDAGELSLKIQVALSSIPDLLLTSSGDASTSTEGIRTLDIELIESIEEWASVEIFGDSARGDKRLPETQARFAGIGRFRLRIDAARTTSKWFGFWAVGDALRRPDGAVRKQGLVFSPLLRDRMGFSDAARQELTLLLYQEASTNAPVILLLVFPDLEMSSGS